MVIKYIMVRYNKDKTLQNVQMGIKTVKSLKCVTALDILMCFDSITIVINF